MKGKEEEKDGSEEEGWRRNQEREREKKEESTNVIIMGHFEKEESLRTRVGASPHSISLPGQGRSCFALLIEDRSPDLPPVSLSLLLFKSM